VGRSFRLYLHVLATAGGTTEIDHVVVREGKNLKGRSLGVVLGTVGKRVVSNAFVNSVKAIQARNATTAAQRA